MKFYPYKKEGVGILLAMLKGPRDKFRGSFDTRA